MRVFYTTELFQNPPIPSCGTIYITFLTTYTSLCYDGFMRLVRMQTYQDPVAIANLRAYAKAAGISVAEAIRRAIDEFQKKPKTAQRQRNRNEDLLKYVGFIKGTSPDLSQNIDEIYNID